MRALLPTLLFASSPAWAWDSEPAELFWKHRVNLFDSLEDIDTGPLPSGSPVAIRFFISTRGGVETVIEGDSNVSWPDPLTHAVTGREEGGFFELTSQINANLVLAIDVDPLYTGSVALWSGVLRFFEETTFDQLLLVGDPAQQVTLVSEGDGLDTLRLPISIVTGLEVAVLLDIFPRASATLTGDRIETVIESESDPSVLTEAGVTTLLAVPASNPGLVELESDWMGRLEAALDLVFVPAAELCVFGSCWTVFDFDLPLTLVDHEGPLSMSSGAYEHPLPAIDVPVSNHDFGEIELGNVRNLAVPILNLGLMDLAGTARIEGAADITVFPSTFYAAPQGEDGLMITFEPLAELPASAKLILESNDPSRPYIEIPLLGQGFVEPPPEQDPGPDGESDPEKIRSCGCATSSGARAAWPALALLALGLRRRR
jgi:MYXO-CTERM domain-containing protein